MERLGGEIFFGCCFFASATAATQKKKAPDGAVTLWPLEPQSMPIRAEDFEQMKAGTLRFYVWGRANYTDVFGIDYKFLGGRASNRLAKQQRIPVYSLPHPQRL